MPICNFFEHVSRHWKVETLSYCCGVVQWPIGRPCYYPPLAEKTQMLSCEPDNNSGPVAAPLLSRADTCAPGWVHISWPEYPRHNNRSWHKIDNEWSSVHLLDVGVRKVQEFGARCLQTPEWKVSEWKSILRKMWQRFSKSKKLTKDIVSGLSVSLCILSSCCNIIELCGIQHVFESGDRSLALLRC